VIAVSGSSSGSSSGGSVSGSSGYGYGKLITRIVSDPYSIFDDQLELVPTPKGLTDDELSLTKLLSTFLPN
jgi:hypothetical protein